MTPELPVDIAGKIGTFLIALVYQVVLFFINPMPLPCIIEEGQTKSASPQFCTLLSSFLETSLKGKLPRSWSQSHASE